MSAPKPHKRKRSIPAALTPTVTSTLIRWFTYNVVFAMVPVIVSITLRQATGRLSWEKVSPSPEFLFFALMLNATALGDLSEVAPAVQSGALYRLLHSALLLGAIMSAVLYGCLAYDGIVGGDSGSLRMHLLTVALWFDVVFLVLTTVAEVLVARIRGSE